MTETTVCLEELHVTDLLRVIAYFGVPHPRVADPDDYARREWAFSYYPAAVARDGVPIPADMDAPSTLPAPILAKAPPSWGDLMDYVNRRTLRDEQRYVRAHQDRLALARKAISRLKKAGYR